jgi:hypothetical protein
VSLTFERLDTIIERKKYGRDLDNEKDICAPKQELRKENVENRQIPIEFSQHVDETRLKIKERTEQSVVQQLIYAMVVGPHISTPSVAITIPFLKFNYMRDCLNNEDAQIFLHFMSTCKILSQI